MPTENLKLPSFYNYFGVFLTMRCNFACSYCINGKDPRRRPEAQPDAAAWAGFFNRLDTGDIPITLQGGEPTLYPGFYDLVGMLAPGKRIDLLTNLSFDLDEFMERVPLSAVTRPAPYAPIRVSYHPEFMDIYDTIARMLRLAGRGYRVGLYSVVHPDNVDRVLDAKSRCLRAGVDFRTKPFLGVHNGTLYGRYRHLGRGSLDRTRTRDVMCRTTDFLCGPDGGIYRCHHDLYCGAAGIADINNPQPAFAGGYRKCSEFGLCEYCDLKVKNNRFQNFGHTTVDIIFPEDAGRAAQSGGAALSESGTRVRE